MADPAGKTEPPGVQQPRRTEQHAAVEGESDIGLQLRGRKSIGLKT